MAKKVNEPWVTSKSAAESSALNLRRLLYFHHETAREAARVIGVTDQAVSGWLAGKRGMTPSTLFRVADIYDIDPRKFTLPPIDFAQILADRDRIETAESNIAKIKGGKEPKPTKRRATVTKLEDRRKS